MQFTACPEGYQVMWGYDPREGLESKASTLEGCKNDCDEMLLSSYLGWCDLDWCQLLCRGCRGMKGQEVSDGSSSSPARVCSGSPQCRPNEIRAGDGLHLDARGSEAPSYRTFSWGHCTSVKESQVCYTSPLSSALIKLVFNFNFSHLLSITEDRRLKSQVKSQCCKL